MNDVLSWDFCTWLDEWSKDMAVDDQMSVAFPANIFEEQVEPTESMDAFWDDEDKATVDHASEVIEEGTLVFG